VSTTAIAQSKAETREKSNLKSRRIQEKVAFGLLWASAVFAVAVMLAVTGYVVVRGIPQVNWEFLTTQPQGGLGGEGGISTTIITTIYLVGLTLAIATPLGVGAAVYLAEYAGEVQSADVLLGQLRNLSRTEAGFAERVRVVGKLLVRVLVSVARFGVETLAGVPSIIFGLFGFALFVSALHFGFSLLSAGLAGACLVLPVIIRASEEALFAVPRSYREGSLALGATKWQTTYKVVLPAAAPGIITGIVLSIGRIVSETAIFYVTLGGGIRMPTSIMSQGRSMALHVYYLAMETRAFDKAMSTGAILILTIILVNLAINLLSRRLSASMRR
jgi:phosphate transport system permease protein